MTELLTKNDTKTMDWLQVDLGAVRAVEQIPWIFNYSKIVKLLREMCFDHCS